MPDKPLFEPDKRPTKLVSYIDANAQKNDALIVEALAKLEAPKTRGKRKPTVASIEQMTGLSRNTIRNRPWAIKRLKEIKEALKRPSEEAKAASPEDDDGTILDKLRKRITHILEQNALLYEEILSLHQIIKNKDTELIELSVRSKELKSPTFKRV
jgi:hypothetical protein